VLPDAFVLSTHVTVILLALLADAEILDGATGIVVVFVEADVPDPDPFVAKTIK
jgi:hypothetical protein